MTVTPPLNYCDHGYSEAEHCRTCEIMGVCLRCELLQPDGVHTIPVPRGWAPEQAWEAITRGDKLTDPEPTWASIVVRDGKLVEVCDGR